jgi:hypothetical protein
MQKYFLTAVALIFILPTTLVAGFWTIVGGTAAIAALIGDSFTRASGVYIVALLLSGWYGIFTLWKLYFAFYKVKAPTNIKRCWFGLVLGTITSLIMLFTFGGSIYFRVLFFGWPIIATLIFAAKLKRM